MAIWCTSAVHDDSAALSDPRLQIRRLVEGEEMTLLDEKIAALFRKSSPISADAEPAPSVDRPVAEEAASEAVVSEPAAEEGSETGLTTNPRRLLRDYGRADKLTMGGIGFRYGDPPPLGTARYQSQANEINARQSR